MSILQRSLLGRAPALMTVVFWVCNFVVTGYGAQILPQLIWTKMSGTTNEERAASVAVSTNQDIYVTGVTAGSYPGQTNNGFFDFQLIKFASNGAIQWEKQWGSSNSDSGRSLAISDDKIIVVGGAGATFDGLANSNSGDMAVSCYLPSGSRIWSAMKGTPSGDIAGGVCFDTGRNVYVTGYIGARYGGLPYAGGSDNYLAKMSTNGFIAWETTWGSSSDDAAAFVCADSSNNIYVAGYTPGAFGGQTNNGGYDISLSKWSSTGSNIWHRLFGSVSNETLWLSGQGLKTDPAGNVYIVGHTLGQWGGQTNAGGLDLFLSKWSPNGTCIWTRIWGSPLDDWANGLAIDAATNIYIYGETSGSFDGQTSQGFQDVVICKFTTDGTRRWTYMWGTPTTDWGLGGICVAPSGVVYAAGYTLGAFSGETNRGSTDVFLTKFQDLDVNNNRILDDQEGNLGAYPASLSFTSIYQVANLDLQTLILTNNGTTPFSFSNAVDYVGPESNWLSIAPPTGSIAPGVFLSCQAGVDSISLTAGVYSATLKILSQEVTNSPALVDISLAVQKADQIIDFQNPGAQATTNSVVLTASASSGLPVKYGLISGPGVLSGGSNLTFTEAGWVSIEATQSGDDNWNPAKTVTNTFLVHTTNSVVRYVWQDSVSPEYPYSTWASAAHTIQDAVDVCQAGDHVLVTNGTYSTGSRVSPEHGAVLLNRVIITNAIFVESVNGPEDTLIVGEGPFGVSAVRCVYIGSNATLRGFTLTNGHTRVAAAGVPSDLAGGGVHAEGAFLENCLITGNKAVDAGGVNAGTLYNCTIQNNFAEGYAGGAYGYPYTFGGSLRYCRIQNNRSAVGGGTAMTINDHCLIEENIASDSGGGTYNSKNYDCVISNNWAEYGGGTENGQSSNSIIVANTSYKAGGGTYNSSLYNCLVYSNHSVLYGGGAVNGEIVNCTIVGNRADRDTGGMFAGVVKNCIIYFNDAPSFPNWSNIGPPFENNCTTPMFDPGYNYTNIAEDPLFVDYPSGDFRLRPGSPCINAGTNTYAFGSIDLEGRPRILGGIIDMGAYESALSQIITFTNPGPQYLTNTLALVASASSGLPVGFTNLPGSPVQWVNATQIVFTGTGTVSIVATQPGDLSWAAAPVVTNTFNVIKAIAQVTLNDLAQTYNGSNRVVTATTVPASLVVAITYDGGAVAPVNAGSYAISGTVEDMSWQGSTTGTLVVSKAAQTINFTNPGAQLTTNIVMLTATAESTLPVGFLVSRGPGTLTATNKLSFTGTGLVSVVAFQTGDSNWSSAPEVTNSFLVSKATATVTITDVQATYDGAAKAAAAVTAPTGLTVVLTYNGSTIPPSNVGNYAVAGVVDDIMYQGVGTGTLSIGKGSQSITFNPVSPQFRTNIVHLTASASSGLQVTMQILTGPGMLSATSNLSFTALGTVVILAHQAGDANWNAAADVTQAVQVIVRSTVGDYDSDKQTDLPIFDPAVGSWFVMSLTNSLITWSNPWGWRTAKPVPGDYNGDGKWDQAVFDTAGGYWYIKTIAGSTILWKNQWGWSTAKPVPGDYNGDGLWDQAVFDTQGGYWYIRSITGDSIAWANQWGWSTAKPVPGDYNGDGKWDQAVFDTVGGYWYIKSLDGNSIAWKVQWGWSTAKPVPGDYDGDGKYDLAVFDTVGGYWYIRTVDGNVITWKNQWGWSTAKPIPGDYNGDGKFDLAVYDTATGYWYIKSLDGTVIAWAVQWGWPGATVPALGD